MSKNDSQNTIAKKDSRKRQPKKAAQLCTFPLRLPTHLFDSFPFVAGGPFKRDFGLSGDFADNDGWKIGP
jgi:hypothetical protein